MKRWRPPRVSQIPSSGWSQFSQTHSTIAAIPRGYGCEEGQTGACAIPDERFAESFAKWALGDIGVGVDLGYKIPPPDDLESWGAPLAALLKA